MLKSSGTQEKKKHILQKMQLLRLVLIEVEKSKDLIFHLIIPFLAINKLRRSGRRNKRCIIRSKLKFTAHSLRCFSFSQKPLVFGSPERCTPSGNPKLKLWLSLLIPKLFSYPLEKRGLFKKSTGFLNSPFYYICGEEVCHENDNERNRRKI